MVFKSPSWRTGKKAEIPAGGNADRPWWHALVSRFSGGYWRSAPYKQLRLALLLQILAFTSGALFFFLWLSFDDAIRIGPRERVLSNLEMHSQRIAQVVPKALQGSPAGFVELAESREAFNRELDLLLHGVAFQVSGLFNPAADRKILLDKLQESWLRIDKATTVIERQEFVLTISSTVFPSLIERYLNDRESLALADINDKKTRQKLREIKKIFTDYQPQLIDIFNHSLSFLAVRQAQQIIASENELLRQHLQNLLEHDQKQHELRTSLPWLMLLAMMLALLSGYGLSRMLSRSRVISEVLERDKVMRVIDLVAQVTLASLAFKEKMLALLSLRQKQVRHSESSEQTMLKISAQLTQMALTAGQAVTLPDRAVVCAKRSVTALIDTEREMRQINEQIKASVSHIDNLGVSLRKVAEMTDLIADIVEQSNILAVNAALQAASADEAGQSFAVIGEELQRQAQQAQNSVQKIVGLLDRMQSEKQSAAAALENANINVVTAVGRLDIATVSLSDVQDTCSQLSGLNALILSSSDQQAQLVCGAVQELQHTLAEDKNGQACNEQALFLLSVLDGKIELLSNSMRHFPDDGSSSNTPDTHI